MRRSSEAFRRATDRRRKEDEAKRLRDAVPSLASLTLDVREERRGMPGHEVQHRRVIVVDRAPALFEFPCSDRACEGGGHDLTRWILHELVHGLTEFSGSDRCHGQSRAGACNYELHFAAHATYRGPLPTLH